MPRMLTMLGWSVASGYNCGGSCFCCSAWVLRWVLAEEADAHDAWLCLTFFPGLGALQLTLMMLSLGDSLGDNCRGSG